MNRIGALAGIVALGLCAGALSAAECDIGQAQAMLAERGHDPGPVDGVLGNATETALRAFQGERGFAVSGKLDNTTCMALGLAEQVAVSPEKPAQSASSDAPATTILPLDMTFLEQAERGAECENHVPDYSEYITIVHITDTRMMDGTANGEPAKLYRARVDGTDEVTGEPRRIGMTVDAAALLSGETGTMTMHFGQPGTRITVDSESGAPFQPVPSISIVKGAVDIDPECGVIVRE